MEIFVILLSSLMALIAPVGVVGDRLAASQIRKQLAGAEQLQVRIDTAPTHQVLTGKIDRIRIAGRGLFPLPEVRIEALELDTDPIQVNPQRLRRGKFTLVKPLGVGVRAVIKAEDVVRALASSAAVNQLRDAGVRVLDEQEARRVNKYELINPRIEFLDNKRVRLQVQIREAGDPAVLDIFAETGLEVLAGRRLQLVDPVVRLNGEPVADAVLQPIVQGIRDRYDLSQLEISGFTARVLQFKLNRKQLELALFLQVRPDAKLNLPGRRN